MEKTMTTRPLDHRGWRHLLLGLNNGVRRTRSSRCNSNAQTLIQLEALPPSEVFVIFLAIFVVAFSYCLWPPVSKSLLVHNLQLCFFYNNFTLYKHSRWSSFLNLGFSVSNLHRSIEASNIRVCVNVICACDHNAERCTVIPNCLFLCPLSSIELKFSSGCVDFFAAFLCIYCSAWFGISFVFTV